VIELAGDGREPCDVVELERAEAMRLVAAAPFGRVLFTRDALPAIRPVNHLVDEDDVIVVRTRLTSRLTGAVQANAPVVVAYQVDDIDAVRRTGWSVMVTGLARTVTDPARVARYEQLLRPWVGRVMDTVVAIEPEIVTGIRLLEQKGRHPR